MIINILILMINILILMINMVILIINKLTFLGDPDNLCVRQVE